MLNKYQTAVLSYIVENQEELIIESAQEENIDANARACLQLDKP